MQPPALEAARFIAGWSSPVARQAHNLKVVGSNPTPATKQIKGLAEKLAPCFLHLAQFWHSKTKIGTVTDSKSQQPAIEPR